VNWYVSLGKVWYAKVRLSNAVKVGLVFRFKICFCFSGDRCQYQDECVDDEDCGRHGKCIDVEATTAPRKQCFCQHGFFGAGCAEGEFIMISTYVNDLNIVG
jgi:hypothetical protein